MANAKMTPLPWGVLNIPNATQCGVVPVNARGKPRNGRDTEDVAGVENREDAEFIVKACNLHDELVEACKDAAAMLAVVPKGIGTDAGEQKELGVKWRSTDEAIASALANLRAVIAKANK